MALIINRRINNKLLNFYQYLGLKDVNEKNLAPRHLPSFLAAKALFIYIGIRIVQENSAVAGKSSSQERTFYTANVLSIDSTIFIRRKRKMRSDGVVGDDRGPPSKSATFKATSSGAFAIRDESSPRFIVKTAVNDWIAAAAGIHCSKQKSKWCLFLETRACFTLNALLAAVEGTDARRCVVPNPSKKECDAIPALCVTTTSHILISGLAMPREAGDAHRALLESNGWQGQFSVVFLDFCGTFDSKPGRARRKDIARLFHCELLHDRSILACTFSQRGTPLAYGAEAVDSVCLFTEFMATQNGYSVTTLGACSYPSFGNKFSQKDAKATATGQVHTVLFAVSKEDDSFPDPRPPPSQFSNLPGASYFAGPWENAGTWSSLDISLPLYNALEFCASDFSTHVQRHLPHAKRALALEGKLLLFSKRLADTACVDVAVVSTNPISGLFASRVKHSRMALLNDLVAVSQTQDPCSPRFDGFKTRLERDWLSLVLGGSDKDFDAVFLDYSARTVPLFRIREYAQGDDKHWCDITTLLRMSRARIVGIIVSFASFGGNEWDGCGVDWVLMGVAKCASKLGKSVDILRAVQFCVTKPSLYLSFYVRESTEQRVHSTSTYEDNDPHGNKAMPASWSVHPSPAHCDWDMRRPKQPTPQSERFRRVAPYLASLACFVGVERVLVKESGGFFVLPALQPHVSCIKHLVVSDDIECQKGFDAITLEQVQPGYFQSFDAIFLLGGNITSWQSTQDSIVAEWAAGHVDRPRLLCVLIDALQTRFYNRFFNGIQKVLEEQDVHCVQDVQAEIILAKGISCLFCTFFVGHDDKALDILRAAWMNCTDRSSQGLFRIK